MKMLNFLQTGLSYSYAYIILIVLLSSCTDKIANDKLIVEENETLLYSDIIEQSLTYFDNQPYSQLPQVQRVEQFLNDLADVHDGFSGFWAHPDDDNHFIVSISRDSNNEDKNNELTSTLKDNLIKLNTEDNRLNPQPRFSTVNSEYTFNELKHFRDLLNPIIRQRNDIVESFIDIRENVYAIGILDNANKDEYHQMLETFAIPKNAISIFKSGPVKTANNSVNIESSIQSNHTLRDRIQPIIGGIQIQSDNNKICTLGFNARLWGPGGGSNYTDLWVTTSSCSNHFSSATFDTDTFFYNPFNHHTNNYQIGIEFRDFVGFTEASGNKYRFSDAVLVSTLGGSSYRKIADPDNGATGWGNSGSINIGYHNTTEIISEDIAPFSIAFKVGRTTGSTSGNIISTCTDIHSNNSSQLPSGWSLNCQIRSDIYTAGGDWGAPLLGSTYITHGESRLYGITWGNNPSQQVSYHSPISAILDELTHSGETLSAVLQSNCSPPLICN